MKKENLFFALILTLVFNACSPSDLFTGDYSYKTSAAVNFYNDTTNLDILLPMFWGRWILSNWVLIRF